MKLASTGAHNWKRATPILSLCYGIFTDQFIFRSLFPPKMKICSLIRFCDVTYDCLKQCIFKLIVS